MKISTGTCLHCGKHFRFYQATKPRGFCSGSCEYKRERQLQNARRQRARLVSRNGTVSPPQPAPNFSALSGD